MKLDPNLVLVGGVLVIGLASVVFLSGTFTRVGETIGDFIAPLFTPDVVPANTEGRTAAEIAEAQRRIEARSAGEPIFSAGM